MVNTRTRITNKKIKGQLYDENREKTESYKIFN